MVNDAVSSSVNLFLTTAAASSGSTLVNVSTRAVLAGAGLLSSSLTGSGNGVPISTLTRSIVTGAVSTLNRSIVSVCLVSGTNICINTISCQTVRKTTVKLFQTLTTFQYVTNNVIRYDTIAEFKWMLCNPD